MARRRRQPEHENHERWLVSYADLLTLMFAFFVVMYSVSQVSEGKFRVLSDSMVAAFKSSNRSLEPIQLGKLARSPYTQSISVVDSPEPPPAPEQGTGGDALNLDAGGPGSPESGEGAGADAGAVGAAPKLELDDTTTAPGEAGTAPDGQVIVVPGQGEQTTAIESSTPGEGAGGESGLSLPIGEAGDASGDATGGATGEGSPNGTGSELAGDGGQYGGPAEIGALESEFKGGLFPDIDKDLVSVRRHQNWMEIEMNTSILFASGSARLVSASIPVLTKIADVLQKFPNPIHVEGYTDNVPIRTIAFPSNWELSAARAASVVHLFMKVGVRPERMVAVGHGEHRPIDDNTTEKGRRRNRRVVLVIPGAEEIRRTMGTEQVATLENPAAPGTAPAPTSDSSSTPAGETALARSTQPAPDVPAEPERPRFMPIRPFALPIQLQPPAKP